MKQKQRWFRRVRMYLDPRALFMLVVLVGVTGMVAKGLMVSWFRLRKDSSNPNASSELDERLRKMEAAMSGVIMDIAAIREKERFMQRLQASASRELPARTETPKEGELNPLMTQNIPVPSRMQR